jgi:hypothetical protein
MDRIAVGAMIALAALVLNGGLVKDVLAKDFDQARAGTPVTLPSPTPVASGLRGERVLSLLLTLEALRAAPGVLDQPKV